MPLGTLDRSAPTLFKHGPSPLSRLALYSALALFLMVADARFRITEPLRKVVATALYPLQWLMLQPVELADKGLGYLQSLQAAQQAAEAEGLWRGIGFRIGAIGRLDVAVERHGARANDVGGAVCIGVTLEDFPRILALAEMHANILATVGVHPENTGVREATVNELVELAQAPEVVAIGETGLGLCDQG